MREVEGGMESSGTGVVVLVGLVVVLGGGLPLATVVTAADAAERPFTASIRLFSLFSLTCDCSSAPFFHELHLSAESPSLILSSLLSLLHPPLLFL